MLSILTDGMVAAAPAAMQMTLRAVLLAKGQEGAKSSSLLVLGPTCAAESTQVRCGAPARETKPHILEEDEHRRGIFTSLPVARVNNDCVG